MAMIQAEQRTVYVARYTEKDGHKHRKVCMSRQGAASVLAWWMIFDKYNDPEHYGLPIPHNSKWTADECTCNPEGLVMFNRDGECGLHGYGGYFDRLHDRFTRHILKAGG